MTAKAIFFDASVLAQVSANAELAKRTIAYFQAHDHVLVLARMPLIELYRRPKHCWDDVAEFIAPLRYCVVQNPDGVLDTEVAAYPGEGFLPIEIDGITRELSASQLKPIPDGVMRGEIADLDHALRPRMARAWQRILKNRNATRPGHGNKYTHVERDAFVRKQVRTMLETFHPGFLRTQSADARTIAI